MLNPTKDFYYKIAVKGGTIIQRRFIVFQKQLLQSPKSFIFSKSLTANRAQFLKQRGSWVRFTP